MKINQILFLFFIILAFSCCNRTSLNQKKGSDLIESNKIGIQTEISYDTLDGIFLYESYVESYISGEDAVTKVGGMIDGDLSVNLKNYKQGYYIIDLNRLMREKENHLSLDFNPITVTPLQSHLEEIFWTHSGYNETEFNPFCGLYYKRFYLKAVAVNIGKIMQKTPLFLECKDFKEYKDKNNGKNYECHKLSTYLVTNVIEWKEVE
ncbi:hypothetical protein [Pleomorphovibrio marinus]|uniref:hypothetical protein n=1 Tax=Pleomorphovibrio marinus TaxID=2164132 RepID=UPI000E0BD729|nr:hypothetical protein [Pleomorphovibrio marinus]